MDTPKLTISLLLLALVSSNFTTTKSLRLEENLTYVSPEKIVHEPKAIIAYQKNTQSAKAKRYNMSDRLALVEEKLANLKHTQSPANALARIGKYLDKLSKMYHVDSDALIMDHSEKVKYDRVVSMQKKLEKDLAKRIERMKHKLANKKTRQKRRTRS